MRNPQVRYQKRINRYNELIRKQTKAIDLISNSRLVVFLAGAAVLIAFYVYRLYILMFAFLIVFLAAFIYLVVKHNEYIGRKAYSSLIHGLNDSSLKRLNGEWVSFTDDGGEFADNNHNYSHDLDIFGNNSLFQWINTANTYTGRRMLKDMLTQRPTGAADIRERQEAVDELALRLAWRQRFHAESLAVSKNTVNPDYLISWANEHNKTFLNKWLILLIRLSPVVTTSLILLAFFTAIIPYQLPALALIAQFATLRIGKTERNKVFSQAEKYVEDIKVYYKMLKLIETRNFNSRCIAKIKDGMQGSRQIPAYKQLDRLSKIIDSISSRHSSFYFLINILTLWDYQNMIALEGWREKSGRLLNAWIDAVGTFEALSSLAIIRYDNPDWAMPKIREGDKPELDAKTMGHPLLTVRRVENDLSMNIFYRILIITGSNMSGKSTLLRTAGINLVLAYAGAPVCARVFCASIMDIYTCMRVSDDLGRNISSFYAELLRIKTIVKEAETGKSLFFLLDEIFKGTNSIDRHTGAGVLIQKLSGLNCIGLVSTHDLELGDLEKDNLKVGNYHFEEYYRENKICFDYKLRKGVSKTRNAVYLMRMAGIDIVE